MITQLGCIGLETNHLGDWLDLAQGILGFELQATEGRDDGPRYLRMDERHHRIELYPSDTEGLKFIGWEVSDRQALDRVVAALDKEGVSLCPGDETTIATRKVEGLVGFQDPGGFASEISFGALVDHRPYTPARAISGFKTGDQGLGHVVLVVEEDVVETMTDFYTRVLDFRVSDYITFGGIKMTFLHCNRRHHSLALMPPAFGFESGGLMHFMVEVHSMDDVGRAFDLCAEREVPLSLGLGKHSNDHMFSFYMKSPSGFDIEYGFGGRDVDDESMAVQTYVSPALWGHQPASEP